MVKFIDGNRSVEVAGHELTLIDYYEAEGWWRVPEAGPVEPIPAVLRAPVPELGADPEPIPEPVVPAPEPNSGPSLDLSEQ